MAVLTTEQIEQIRATLKPGEQLCNRCGWTWTPSNPYGQPIFDAKGKQLERIPKQCPNCKTPYYNRPRIRPFPPEAQK